MGPQWILAGVLNPGLGLRVRGRRRPSSSYLWDLQRLLWTLVLLGLTLMGDCVSSNYDTSMVHRLLQDRETLIQDGLSYFNGTTLRDIEQHNAGHEVRCIISIENWTRWMLSFPVVYTHYGDFQFGFHEREVFAAHREIVVTVNDLDSITGSSGVIAWELGEKNIHLILMWSVPYNLNFFNAHFGFGMVHLTTKFTRDMLPYWYRRMYEGDPGSYKRGEAGTSLVYKHHDVFILGHLEADSYQPVLNVSVMPWSTKNLAPSIWHQLYLQTVRDREAQPFSKASSPNFHSTSRNQVLIIILLTLVACLRHSLWPLSQDQLFYIQSSQIEALKDIDSDCNQNAQLFATNQGQKDSKSSLSLSSSSSSSSSSSFSVSSSPPPYGFCAQPRPSIGLPKHIRPNLGGLELKET